MSLSTVAEMKYTYYHYFLKKIVPEFYECPSDFFHADKHSVFTRDFDSINVKFSTATVYYYGIDTKTYEPKVTKLAYSQADDCFYIDNGIQDSHIKAFEKEVKKEALYLKHNANNRQKDLKGQKPCKSSAVSWCCWLCLFRQGLPYGVSASLCSLTSLRIVF